MRRAQVGVLALAGVLAGCASATELHVSVDVDDALLPREQILEVLAFDDGGVEIYRSEQLVGGTSGIDLPAGVRVLPRSGADGAWLRFVLRSGPSDVRVQRDVWLAFVPGEVRAASVRLDAACEGVACGEGTTCACAEAGCSAPDCVEVGRCDAPRACEGGREQRCEEGGLALSCAPMEIDG